MLWDFLMIAGFVAFVTGVAMTFGPWVACMAAGGLLMIAAALGASNDGAGR